MSKNKMTEGTALNKKPFFRQLWFMVFLSGLVLFLISDLVLTVTANYHFVPVVLLLGSFLVPVTLVAYIYNRAPKGEIPNGTVLITFLWGGALGVAVAGFLEYATLRQLGAGELLGVGLIEESAKMIIPIVIFLRGRYHHEADGLLFGVAAGMGFAGLETMGYGFSNFLQSQGDVNTLNQVLLVRGLLSPSGHAAWTGIVCAALWHEREKAGHAVVNWMVIGAFLLAVLLHALWDIASNINQITGTQLIGLDYFGLFLIGGTSLWLLIWRLRKAHHVPIQLTEERIAAKSTEANDPPA